MGAESFKRPGGGSCVRVCMCFRAMRSVFGFAAAGAIGFISFFFALVGVYIIYRRFICPADIVFLPSGLPWTRAFQCIDRERERETRNGETMPVSRHIFLLKQWESSRACVFL